MTQHMRGVKWHAAAQVIAVRARLLQATMSDAEVQELAPRVPVDALRAHLHRRHYNIARVRSDAVQAHVEYGPHNAQGFASVVRVFWPDGTVDRL